MRKEHKEELRQDEFRTSVELMMDWLGAHRDEVRIGLIAALILTVGIGALSLFRARRDKEVGEAMRSALVTFEASVTSELPAQAERPSGPSFATAEEKYSKAMAEFDGVVRRHGSHALARQAKYYAALCRIELAKYPEAETALQELTSRNAGTDTEAGLARLALAQLYRRSGQLDKAADTYRQIAADPNAGVPRDFAQLELAASLEQARQWKEARASYLRLIEEFPASSLVDEARRRAEYLETAKEG